MQNSDIHQQITHQPIHQPGLFNDAFRHLGKCHLQLVQHLFTAFIHPRRLAGRTDKHAGEEIG
jgi:hypothetical protein